MEKRYLLLDQGNSRLKYQLLNNKGEELEQGVLSNSARQHFPEEILTEALEQIIICASGRLSFRPEEFWPQSAIHYFTHRDASAIEWAYQEISQMGTDRMAALLGAQSKFPGCNLVVADAGTCLTVDLLRSDGKHLGGFISPGYQMRLRAMHEFTKALPLPEAKIPGNAAAGQDTLSCMQAGAFSGLIAEILAHFSTYAFGTGKAFSCILTGGDAENLAHHLKESTFVAPDLVFTGLFSIRRH
jgi:type III pantothenate kinase